jgi:hypothetical protein
MGNFSTRFRFVTLLAPLCLLPACGSDDGDSKEGGGSNAGGSASSGGSATTSGGSGNPTAGTSSSTNTCGLQSCSAGQYCANGICMNGCLTDTNCGSGQTCRDIDAETKVGTCRNQDPEPPAKDCNAFCDKALACQDPEWVQCMQVCTGLSAACVACVNDSNCGAGCDSVCEL